MFLLNIFAAVFPIYKYNSSCNRLLQELNHDLKHACAIDLILCLFPGINKIEINMHKAFLTFLDYFSFLEMIF